MDASYKQEGAPKMADRIRLPVLNVVPPAARERDTSRTVMLIGFQRQANLGLGYLAATLRSFGYRVEVLDFEQDRREILAAAKAADPILIGFSLIFQFYIDQF